MLVLLLLSQFTPAPGVTSQAIAPSSVTTPLAKLDVVDAGVLMVAGQAHVVGPLYLTGAGGVAAYIPLGSYISLKSDNSILLRSTGASIESSNPFIPSNDNQSDLGGASVQWRYGYFGTNVVMGARSAIAAAPKDGGSPFIYEEYGNCTLSASACAITFKNAFGVGPRCTCSHINAVPIPCGPSAAASTTAVTFNVPAGSGVVDWHCIGDR